MKKDKLSFVVHEHLSKTHHYDFRLEINGELVSWATPKGPTLDPTIKRLSIQTEEHFQKKNDFSGIIDDEKYGEGLLTIWDEGSYIPEVEISKGVRKEIKDLAEGEKVMSEGLDKGEIKFFLNGKKIKGSFALVKTKGFPPGVKNAWLLIKHKDEFCKTGFEANDYNETS